ncbi:SRPBCC family protein [Microbacteriaceae bacterium VKM Ac-2855]|nr:SRPBCC family protein [Microbacteriaceae bacterium VKM Ac-2855]
MWDATQDPREHVRWDVRFSEIVPEPVERGAAAHFTYVRRSPVHDVHGRGVSIGDRWQAGGGRTSALRFATDDRLSPIRSGRGYWRYVPTADGRTRFITGYDYEAGWGVLDLAVRPLLGWATAWSFDRLRIWLEGGAEPESWPLISVLSLWRRDRPRAARSLRAPAGGTRRADHLQNAPASLAGLPDPEAAR